MNRRPTFIRPGVRQAEIRDLIVKRGEISVDALVEKFDTSAETIRRDLTALADAGHIRKIHGGARAIAPQGEGAFGLRLRRNALAKHRIAEKLIDLVVPHTTLFMDTGTTNLICAEVLSRVKNLKVITNSSRIAEAFATGRGGADVYLLGGRYRDDNAQTVGGTTIRQIADYRADMAILTVGTLDGQGAMDYSSHEAEVARAMIKASNSLTVVADRSKFMRTTAFGVCDLAEIDRLVCDQMPDGGLEEHLKQADVEVFG